MTKITDRAMLVALNVSQWTARKHDRDVSEEVAREHHAKAGAEDVGRYNKILIDKNAVKPLQTIVSEARAHHYFATLPWSDTGHRILTAAGYFPYCQRMQDFRLRFEAAADDFAAAYLRHVEEARVRLNGMFREEDYPRAVDIRHKFALGVSVMPLPDAEDFRVSSLGADEEERIRADIRQRMEREISEAAKEPWRRIHEAVSHISERLGAFSADKGVFRDSLVDNLRDLVAVLPSLNITGDSELERMRADLEAKLCRHSAVKLRNDVTARKETKDAADAILQAMAGYAEPAAA